MPFSLAVILIIHFAKLNIIDFFKTFGNLADEEINFAIGFFISKEIKKGEFYLKEGQVPDKVTFIEKGLFRLFYQLNGEERIMLFFSESQLMTDYFGFLTNSASVRPIQALEDSVIHSIEKKNLYKLFDYSKNWERIGRHLAESAYVTSVLRANRLLHDDYNTRVQTFINESPSLIQRVPQYMIASYLNMTPETLSRVKRRIMKEGVVKSTIHKIKE
jgi:CRP/FNR family transcriptional regulator, anaerobic regulatory protein